MKESRQIWGKEKWNGIEQIRTDSTFLYSLGCYSPFPRLTVLLTNPHQLSCHELGITWFKCPPTGCTSILRRYFSSDSFKDNNLMQDNIPFFFHPFKSSRCLPISPEYKSSFKQDLREDYLKERFETFRNGN